MNTIDLSLLQRKLHGRRALCRQSGFSLIELMVAIAIALFLVAGVMGIVMSVRGSFKTQNGLTQIQETQRFLLTALNNTIRMSGYFPYELTATGVTDTVAALPASTTANSDGTTFIAGQAISGTTGAGAASDTINVRYRVLNNDVLMDCQGDTNTSGAAVVWTNSYAVNAARQLTCTVSTNGGAAGTAVILVDNVSALKILYGVDTNGDGSVDRYLSSAEVAASTGGWQSVSTVQLAITLLDPVNSTPTTTANLPKTLMHTIKLMNQV